MKRLNARVVEFDSPVELRAHYLFDRYLTDGQGVPKSAELAINRAEREFRSHPRVGSDFIHYLSDGTVERQGSRVRVRPVLRNYTRESP